MNGFLKWFFAFMSEMLKGYAEIVSGFGRGIKQIFDIKNYIEIFKEYSTDFGALGWILSILSLIIVIAIYVLIIVMIFLLIRKYIRFRHSLVSNEDLLEEIALLQRRVMKMAKEKDEIMAMKVAQMGGGTGTMTLPGASSVEGEEGAAGAPAPVAVGTIEDGVVQTTDYRFSKLIEVDTLYKTYTPPEYDNEVDLAGICDRFRNFACSRMHLFYEPKTIRLFIAGMAST
jgi:hypothetical protein